MRLRDIQKMDRDELLAAIGLSRRGSMEWILPTASALGVGLLLGAAFGLLLAPKAGWELRDDLTRRLKEKQSSLGVPGAGLQGGYAGSEKRTS